MTRDVVIVGDSDRSRIASVASAQPRDILLCAERPVTTQVIQPLADLELRAYSIGLRDLTAARKARGYTKSLERRLRKARP